MKTNVYQRRMLYKKQQASRGNGKNICETQIHNVFCFKKSDSQVLLRDV